MWHLNEFRSSIAARRATQKVSAAIDGTGDTLKAWNAVWDLVHSGEPDSLHDVREILTVHAAGDPAARSTLLAKEFLYTIEQPIHFADGTSQVLPSREVRDEHKRMQDEARHEALRRMGVQPGEGLPMWALYMTRRSKRSWPR